MSRFENLQSRQFFDIFIYMYTPNKQYPPILKALKKYYGYDSFRPGQVELIHHLLDGHDVLGIMPTGAGKSVCFQIPAIFMPGITLVISPLISLMKDQVASLIQAKIPAAYLNSSLTQDQYRLALRRAKEGRYKIIYVAPERLNTPGFLDFAHSVNISMIAVDEAHCISQWGQNFRPSYLKIPEFAKQLPSRPIFAAFTATATGPVKDDIAKQLDLHDPYTLITGFDRKNLYFEVQHPADKMEALFDFLEQHSHEAGIVYCLTRKETEEVCDQLNAQGYRACRYHGGLSDEERSANQDAFLYDRVDIIVATNAFGMGIDKSNVRYVVHYSLPSSLENYYQEAGRAGRDGAPAHCLLLYKPADIHINRFLIDKSYEESLDTEIPEGEDPVKFAAGRLDQKNRELHLLKTMETYATTPMCLRSYILQYFGESSSGNCGHCSNCNSNWTEEDISETAQIIYNALNQLPRSYGMSLTLDYLSGKASSKLKKAGLNYLSAFGCLKDIDPDLLKLYLESLLIQGYLLRSNDMYQVVSTTRKFYLNLSKKIPIQVQFRQNELHSHKRKSKSRTERDRARINPYPEYNFSPKDDRTVFDHLKTVRTQLARKNGVPPYVIFSDATLMEMAKALPQTKQELLSIPGVGDVKVERYGPAFLTAIKAQVAKQKKDAESVKLAQEKLFHPSADEDLTSKPGNPQDYARMSQTFNSLLKRSHETTEYIAEKEDEALRNSIQMKQEKTKYVPANRNDNPVHYPTGVKPYVSKKVDKKYESTSVVYSSRTNRDQHK